MGSRSKIALAYIAGFLDGDGSLMLQVKKRFDRKLNWRFMATICFYQDTRHEQDLAWIKKVLGIGYLSHRKDGMSELRINGFSQIQSILEDLLPHIRFKKKQARVLYQAVKLLQKRDLKNFNLLKLISYIQLIRNNNYISKHRKTVPEMKTILGLTP